MQDLRMSVWRSRKDRF